MFNAKAPNAGRTLASQHSASRETGGERHTGTDWVAACVSKCKVRIGAQARARPSYYLRPMRAQKCNKKKGQQRRTCAAAGAESQMRSGLERQTGRLARNLQTGLRLLLQKGSCPCPCPALVFFPCRCTSHTMHNKQSRLLGASMFNMPVGGLMQSPSPVASVASSHLICCSARPLPGTIETRFGNTQARF